MKKICLALLLTCLAFPARTTAEVPTWVKSALIPGMGQLSEGQKVKGLGVMGAEIFCLHMMFSQLAEANGQAQKSIDLNNDREREVSIEKIYLLSARQDTAYDLSKKAQTWAMAWGAAAAVVWVGGVVDALIFGKSGKQALLPAPSSSRWALQVDPQNNRVQCQVRF